MITNACVNIIVPLTILGLLANFIPYLLVIIPLEEQDVCWFYYLTRSPYQLDFISMGLYQSASLMRYLIYSLEMSFLVFSIWQIRNIKDNSQINIMTESKLIATSWFLFTFFNLMSKIIEKSVTVETAKILQIAIFTSI